jgi:NDP-sugar pyrophosphorylase family protein
VKAIVLAAGTGSRLRPWTDQTPKPLLPVGGRPMIEYSLLLLKKYGITEVIINVHHLGEMLMRAVGDGARLGMQITYSEESTLLGTAGAIKKVQSQLEGESFVAINSDILIDLDLDAVLAFHLKHPDGAATLVLRESEEAARFGLIEIDDGGRIRSILGEGLGHGVQRTMFTGVHLIRPRVLDFLPREGSITDVYIDMLKKGEALYGYLTNGYFCDLGTPERYHRANEDLASGAVCLRHVSGMDRP